MKKIFYPLLTLFLLLPLVGAEGGAKTSEKSVVAQIQEMDKSCRTASDCVATYLTASGCRTMCNQCGFLINVKEKARYEELMAAAPKVPLNGCPMGDCASMHCKVVCENSVCGGKNVMDR